MAALPLVSSKAGGACFQEIIQQYRTDSIMYWSHLGSWYLPKDMPRIDRSRRRNRQVQKFFQGLIPQFIMDLPKAYYNNTTLFAKMQVIMKKTQMDHQKTNSPAGTGGAVAPELSPLAWQRRGLKPEALHALADAQS